MMLSGNAIAEAVARGEIVIDPFDPARCNPNSYNVALHDELVVYTNRPKLVHDSDQTTELGGWVDVLDMKRDNPSEILRIPVTGLVLMPGRLYLGRTVEYTESPIYVPMVEGRSSVGRLGMAIHATAGVGDRGFKGHFTLEITVPEPLRIYPGVQVGQLLFYEVDQKGPVYGQDGRPGGKYLNNRGSPPGTSGLWKELQHARKQGPD